MTIKYHLKFNNSATGEMESFDLDEVKRVRDSLVDGGVITALNQTFTITNDPEFRVFDGEFAADEADAAIRELAEERFQRVQQVVLIDPQPEGLND